MKPNAIIIISFIIVILAIIYIILMNNNSKKAIDNNNTKNAKDRGEYMKITAKDMKEQTDTLNKNSYVILDVRTKEEYDEERIPGSTLLTLDEIEYKASEVLPDKDIKIYVYCRSGRRSLEAAYKLIDLGYKNVYDFGGIIDYPYETIKGE